MFKSPSGTEVERKFILSSAPDDMLGRGREIHQGYLSGAGHDVEVRVRAVGRRYFMTLKTGAGLVRREQEVRIPRKTFKVLWPFTQAARIAKTRYTVRDNGHEIEIDVYQDNLESLVVAEIEFESPEQAAAAELPPWIGTEITGLPGFSNSSLAHHGLPADINIHRPESLEAPVRPLSHAGAIPYRKNNGKLEILCITSKSGKRWIVPKGQWEEGFDLRETAVMEAWEESGAVGTLADEAVGIYDDDRSGRVHRILVYPMQVDEVKDDWPESGARERRWLGVRDAAKAIDFAPLCGLVKVFGKQYGR